jgi:hypothetical protein
LAPGNIADCTAGPQCASVMAGIRKLRRTDTQTGVRSYANRPGITDPVAETLNQAKPSLIARDWVKVFGGYDNVADRCVSCDVPDPGSRLWRGPAGVIPDANIRGSIIVSGLIRSRIAMSALPAAFSFAARQDCSALGRPFCFGLPVLRGVLAELTLIDTDACSSALDRAFDFGDPDPADLIVLPPASVTSRCSVASRCGRGQRYIAIEPRASTYIRLNGGRWVKTAAANQEPNGGYVLHVTYR